MTRMVPGRSSQPFNDSNSDRTVVHPKSVKRSLTAAVVVQGDLPSFRKQPSANLDATVDFAEVQSELCPNRLLGCASMLLAISTRIRNAAHHPDPAGLQRELIKQIRRFEEVARRSDCNTVSVRIASFWLCVLLDDAVMRTPWGLQCDWRNHGLVQHCHRHTSGRSACFDTLSRSLQSEPIDGVLLEFCYVCLSVGFEGHYREQSDGRNQLDALRRSLYGMIQTQSLPIPTLCGRRQGFGSSKTPYRVPMWIIASVFTCVWGVGYLALNQWIKERSEPVLRELQSLGGR